ncbi:phospholipase D-like domain-containing protein [Mycolicibacterium fluoranthenivorans]|nr:phospholipase D-like domain-containing protein [Mycolicibacterium fluoranthenivorans]
MKVYANDDDALIIWNVPAAIPDCLGFAIKRRTYDPTDPTMETVAREEFLPNRIGFVGDPKAGPDSTASSKVWPFQRFWWTDHAAAAGDILSYQVMPMLGTVGHLKPATSQASEWSPIRVLSAPPNSRFNPFFNRGFVISQFMARYLAEKKLTPRQFKENIRSNDEDMIRKFLYGYLGPALFSELRDAASSGGEIFAALYELDDDQLIELLCVLGPRAHVVLSNGSIPHKKGHSMADERKQDQNAEARAKLLGANVDVGEADRFTSPGALAHNKFLVRTDANGDLVSCWTGSTNWTTTGLCTQLNNGLLIYDTTLAQEFLDQWHRLREAGSAFPTSLVDSNSQPAPFDAPAAAQGFAPFPTPPPPSSGDLWFTRTRGTVDLDALNEVVEAATTGILFLMFQPGAGGVLPTVEKAAENPNLYVRGVVSELPADDRQPRKHEEGHQVDVTVVRDAQNQQLKLDIVEPEGNDHPLSHWAVAEMTHGLFNSQIGHAIVHSKTLVIDPFGDHPVVVTGSHNFSTNASTKNDENFLIIRDDPTLAEAYAVHIMAAYDHYRFRAAQGDNKGLSRSDDWMAPKLATSLDELRVWGVRQ